MSALQSSLSAERERKVFEKAERERERSDFEKAERERECKKKIERERERKICERNHVWKHRFI